MVAIVPKDNLDPVLLLRAGKPVLQRTLAKITGRVDIRPRLQGEDRIASRDPRRRRRYAAILSSLVALTVATAASVPGHLAVQTDDDTNTPPNILVFLSDDMGWGQPGFNGGTEVTTPNMDRIAIEGVKLTQFYVQPVCTPTRGSLLTGRYDWKNGTETRVALRDSQGMLTDERTIAEALGDAGYATWIVGKWHLGQWSQEHLPLQRGFDHHYGHYSGAIDSFTLHRGRNRGRILDWHRNGRPVVESGYSTFLLADEAVQLIERHDGSHPFFLYLPFNAVHNPNDAPQEYIDLYSDSSYPEQRGQLKAMDDAIGQVLDALDEKGVLDDTLIMFLNDNGGTHRAGWNEPYRGKKSEYHEGGIRVPAVLRWPDEIPAGSESDALLHVVDLFPTFAGLAGADTTSDLPLDGLDAWKAIAEGAESPRTELVYSLDVIRVGDWKLIDEGIDYYGWTTDAPELYNIAEDPYEATNLAASETAKVAELLARLAYHRPFARDGEAVQSIPDHPPDVYGEEENTAFGAAARRAVTQLRKGNPGPTLLRMEAAGDSVKLTYGEALDADSVPSADSFKVVVNPGYTSAQVTDVAVSGSAVTLTLAEAPGSGKTVGLTYEVPNADPIQDADDLEAVGLTWVTAAVTAAFVSQDAMLRALSLSGIDIGTFSGAVTSYTASVGSRIATTTVTATASQASATVSISPGAEVSLAEGANEITVAVTAEDGTTTRTYSVTVTRAALPVVSIVAVATPVSEGGPAEFRVSRTGSTTQDLTVKLDTGGGTGSTRFPPGRSSSIGYFRKNDDTVVEDDHLVAWKLKEGEGYKIAPDAASATVVMEDNDVAEFELSVTPAEIAEGESATAQVRITNAVTFAKDQEFVLDFAGSTATRGTDYTVSPESLTLSAGMKKAAATVTAISDSDQESDDTVSLAASHDGAAIGTASLTIADSAFTPLTAEFVEMPETRDGETEFGFELRFSEEIKVSFTTLRDAAFEVTEGTVRRARRLVKGSNVGWEIRVQPASDADVVLVLPVTTDCEAAAAVCTASGKPLSNRLEASVTGPASQALGQGFSLAPDNASPSGIWSMEGTAWVADVDDAKLYAYQRSDGSRQPERDIPTDSAPMGLWSDGEMLWVAGLDGGLRAHRLADGSRLAGRDLTLEMNAAPVGLWSDGETVWVAEWLGDAVHAYRLADGQRVASRDIRLTDGNLLPVGLSSDGETLWVADWEERMYAYRLSDGERLPERDIRAGTRDEDPSGLWSEGRTLLSTSWKGSEVRAYRLPAAVSVDEAVDASAIPDPALLAGIAAALGKAAGEAVSEAELAGLETLQVRSGGVRDLTGLEGAVALRELDLGFNPLADLRPLAFLPALESLNLDRTGANLREVASLTGLKRLSLRQNGIDDLGPLAGLASLTELDVGDNPIDDLRPVAFLPALEALNLDGTGADLQAVASLIGLKRLSLRHSGIDDLRPLAGLVSLTELDVGDNRIEDLYPLAGWTRLVTLRADRNRIANLWPLASLAGLEALDLTANRLRGVDALAELGGLRTLRLGGNGLTEVVPLSGLDGLRELGLAGNAVEDLGPLSDLAELQRLDLRGNEVGDLRPLRALKSLVWVHVGGSRIEDLAPLDGMDSLLVFGQDDRDPPGDGGPRGGRANEH